eukprot:SAG22_NODE_649_length_8157_cov_30.400099_2_plen_316_part_00
MDFVTADRPRVVLVVRAAGWAVGVLAAAAMLLKSWGGAGAAATFAWHPALMSLGFSGLMTEGMLAYIAKPARSQPHIRGEQRGVHAAVQAGAGTAAIAGFIWCAFKLPERVFLLKLVARFCRCLRLHGSAAAARPPPLPRYSWLVVIVRASAHLPLRVLNCPVYLPAALLWHSIWMAHAAGGKSQFGLDEGTSAGRRIHIGLGYLVMLVSARFAEPAACSCRAAAQQIGAGSDPRFALCARARGCIFFVEQGTVAQCLIGGVKRWAAPRPVHKWHGKAGPYIWGYGLLNILCGVWIWGGWSTGCVRARARLLRPA